MSKVTIQTVSGKVEETVNVTVMCILTGESEVMKFSQDI